MTLNPKAKDLLTEGEAESNEAISAVRMIFGIDDIEDRIEIKLTLEGLLWEIIQQLPTPISPLKVIAHKRFIDEGAEVLAGTEDLEDVLPVLSPKLLNELQKVCSDDEFFDKLTVPFLAINAKDGTIRKLPLPAKNITRDLEFVETLAMVFEAKLNM